ncbi:MAG: diguanylate cyclase, partial [Gammaproteobacteria bacterium]|nr:diguanylate cyclase [Gammaproteobacteria bacterium]
MASNPGTQLERRLLMLLAFTTLVPLGALAYLSYHNAAGILLFGSVSRYSLVFTSVGGLALLASCIVATRMLRHKFKLIGDLEDVVHMLARGDYSRRIDLTKSGEFTSLGRAFNEMTEQLEHSLKSSQSVADIDRLILSSADLDTVLRKVLLSARTIRGEITLILRPDMNSNALSTYRMDKRHLVEGSVGILEVSDDSLRDVDGYERVAARVCGENVWVCLAIETAGVISGALVATGESAPKTTEVQQLGELADRLSVAITNIERSDSLYQKAHFDDLTGLINRHAFEDRLREQISRSWRGEKGAVMFIDLDDFKKVNDTEGHKAGDRLLIEISKRLAAALREVDTIARLGGDEFAVIVPGCDDEKSVSRLCERIIKSLTKPIVVDRMEHTVGASIGVALFPDDGRAVEELVMKADSAMYRAKETGRARFAFFDDTLNEANRHRVLVESRLRGAIKRGELELHFQPILDLKTR